VSNPEDALKLPLFQGVGREAAEHWTGKLGFNEAKRCQRKI
jgi:hypothetical protein